MMRTQITNRTYDEERALYHLQNTDVIGCTFAGPQDGESALKESRDVTVQDCTFSLRYPLWHAQDYRMIHSSMDDKTRAPIWYARDGVLSGSRIDGIKCLRECDHTRIEHCNIHSPEFGWRCRDINILDTSIESEYLFFECRDMEISKLQMKGKYSFQYTHNIHIRNSILDTKDAFWHSENVTVEDSTVKGEYLGWFSKGLTLINCNIIGTQPLCYCDGLKLVNCTMEGTDLAFEYSEVEADIRGHILSVKNPKSGTILADSIGDIIWDDPIMECTGKVLLRNQPLPLYGFDTAEAV